MVLKQQGLVLIEREQLSGKMGLGCKKEMSMTPARPGQKSCYGHGTLTYKIRVHGDKDHER